ncbi:ribbon-helix-helix protein, CopG family [Oscillibacter sp.]|uniref:ribbon-helix-helix protein, CopG family n=1 Tax=Oscillibacter sp. TaxID=1945593 RepID=UPI00289BE640|nr:ribbon-helix-helix protein, CopG family [Oscillibacter sp.]
MTDMRRITISLPDDLDAAVEALKGAERFKGRTYSQIIRYLLTLGLKSEDRRGT